jgi:hypothetical protein
MGFGEAVRLCICRLNGVTAGAISRVGCARHEQGNNDRFQRIAILQKITP